MRIAIDARSIEATRTGVGRLLINLLKQWSRESGHEFVLYFKTNVPTDDFLHQVPFTLKKLEPLFGRDSNFLFEHVLLPRALKQDKADVLYAPAYTAPFFCPVPYVVALHDISYEAHPEWNSPDQQFVRRFMSRRSANRAAGIITISQFSRSEIKRLYNIPDQKLNLVYQCAVDEALLAESTNQDPLPEQPYTLFVGSFFNRRHLPELIKAIETVNQNQDLRAVFVGQDHTYPAQNITGLIAEANQRAGKILVYQYKSLNDSFLSRLYRQANSVSLLSEYEGFGMPLLEGMALGTPVLIAPGSSLEEVAAGAALVTDPHNPNQIATDLKRLLNDSELRADLIAKAKIRAQDFNWQTAANETLKAITNVQR